MSKGRKLPPWRKEFWDTGNYNLPPWDMYVMKDRRSGKMVDPRLEAIYDEEYMRDLQRLLKRGGLSGSRRFQRPRLKGWDIN